MLSFFFFKQNTAYEMRISDWSSDVCSSDLLKSIGEYDNTMIVFFSDNGADGMGYGFIPFIDSNLNLDIDNSLANYGRQGSFIFRSTRWAEVGTAPFRLFKSFPSEGGISVPAIVKIPGSRSLADRKSVV